VFGFLNLNAQTYNYSYSDPCTGNLKTLVVPINGSVTVGYYGFVESFTNNDFTNGNFETWANNIFANFDGSPCAEIVGLNGTINIAQDAALNTVGLINSLSALLDFGGGSTDFLTGSIGAASKSSSTEGSKKNGKRSQNGSGGNITNNNNSTTNNTQNQSNGTSNTNEGSTTNSGTNETSSNGGNGTPNSNVGNENPTQAGGTTTQGGSNENGNTSSSTTVNENGETPINNETTSGNENNSGNVSSGNNGVNGNGGTNTSNENTEETTTGGQTNITGGATKTINANREGGKPTVIASSDFVGFNFQNSEVRTGLKLTGGYHNMRWDGEVARGVLIDYVSAQKGPNTTGYWAWINKRSVGILSSTLSVGFEGRGSVYGTIAGGQMLMFPKVKGLKAIYMGTISYGQVYKTPFVGTALIAGGMYDLKIGKRYDIKLMNLFVYSPYVSYYNDLVLKSPYVILPSIGTNIGITKKFKFNINAGGAWAIKVNSLNYTITCGARLLVGQ
jgi:hypothetical protein